MILNFGAALAVAAICVSCNRTSPQTQLKENVASINLSAITSPGQTQLFHEVMQVRALPKGVRDALEGGIADPGQPFNGGDLISGELPMRSLIVAAVSEKYCILSYWRGGTDPGPRFQTVIFELSELKPRLIWLSESQGGLNFRDLKEMIELGRMHNDLGQSSPI